MRPAFALVLLALAAGPSRSAAQVTPTIYAGAAWSHLHISAAADCSNCANFADPNEPGVAAGIGVAIPVVSRFAAAPELLYVGKGFEPAAGYADLAGCCMKFGYVELPLLAQVRLGDVPQQFDLFVGPYLADRISCTNTGESVVVTLRASASTGDCGDPEQPALHDLDYGLTFGGGFHINRVSITLRADFGLRNLRVDQGSSVMPVHNRSLLALAGFDLR